MDRPVIARTVGFALRAGERVPAGSVLMDDETGTWSTTEDVVGTGEPVVYGLIVRTQPPPIAWWCSRRAAEIGALVGAFLIGMGVGVWIGGAW